MAHMLATGEIHGLVHCARQALQKGRHGSRVAGVGPGVREVLPYIAEGPKFVPMTPYQQFEM
jgi:hypothetical protein